MPSDLILETLRKQREPLGSLGKAFPGRAGVADNAHWMDEWFLTQTAAFLGANPPDAVLTSSEASSEVLSQLRKAPATSRVRLNSIQPHYFRGFRGHASPIALEADLVVIEGRNSSGKTSLAEAFEWLFTGQLSRRASGHARELAKCIGNEFRPSNERTWVEGIVTVDDRSIRIRRVLVEDYSDRLNAVTTSELLVDGKRVTQPAADKLLDRLFAGVAPIMMQHTMGQFIHDSPDNRRHYFERLLQLDELTTLIEKAVIGDLRAAEFMPPVGAVSCTRWKVFCASLKARRKAALDRLAKNGAGIGRVQLEETLLGVGIAELRGGADDGSGFQALTALLQAEHARDRDRRFPFLNDLRPPATATTFAVGRDNLETAADGVDAAVTGLMTARNAIKNVTDAELAIARAMDSLVVGGLVDPAVIDATTCPVCDYQPVPTLTAHRIDVLRTRVPLAAAVDAAVAMYQKAIEVVAAEMRGAGSAIARTKIAVVSEADLKPQLLGLDPALVLAVVALNGIAAAFAEKLRLVQSELSKAEGLLANDAQASEATKVIRGAADMLAEARRLVGEYIRHFGEVDKALGVVALDDPRYALREKWLDAAADVDGIVQAIRWEGAKINAQHCLKDIRDGLIQLRTEIIEAARRDFSERMTEVWRTLRIDTASSFSQLHIPEVKGKGYKLEMEVKARISDGVKELEVDALKVFSESQVNALGLAACITRAKLLGHAVMIFDDPVQSMDEEHHRSFAAALVSGLIEQGFQVVILTHSEQFSRDLADAHYGRDSFVTLRSRASKRHGAVIEEGNRRVVERLKNADALADDGKLDDAWNRVRLAIERMYMLAYARATPDFDTRSWRTQTAEAMWNNGAGTVIENVVPGSGEKLKTILTLTAAGAHDAPARGVTDLKAATKCIRSLLSPLKIGDG